MLCQDSSGRNGDCISHCAGTTHRQPRTWIICCVLAPSNGQNMWLQGLDDCSEFVFLSATNNRKKKKSHFWQWYVKVFLSHLNPRVCLYYRLFLLVQGSLCLKAWEQFQANCSIGLLHPTTKRKFQPRLSPCRDSLTNNTPWATQWATF